MDEILSLITPEVIIGIVLGMFIGIAISGIAIELGERTSGRFGFSRKQIKRIKNINKRK
jgi:flagellar biosynthesis protein FliR